MTLHHGTHQQRHHANHESQLWIYGGLARHAFCDARSPKAQQGPIEPKQSKYNPYCKRKHI